MAAPSPWPLVCPSSHAPAGNWPDKIVSPCTVTNAAQKLAEVKHRFGLRVEAFGWMTVDARIARDISLTKVSITRGNYATHHQLVIAQVFQTGMETAHMLSHILGVEYAKAVSAHLAPNDTAAHDWVRNGRDTFSMVIIEEKLCKDRG